MDAAAPTPGSFWRKCSVCKKPIGFRARYYVCSVSTCNGQRTGYVFDSVGCFESHIPGARHKSAGAIEKTSPSQAEALAADATVASGVTPSTSAANGSSSVASDANRTPQRVIARPTSSTASPSTAASNQISREVLVIASRLKDYITARSEFNTSQSVMDVLSDHLRIVCDRAIEQARSEGRKTVMDRDFSFLKK